MSGRPPPDPKAPRAAWMNRADMKIPANLCATVHQIVALQDKFEQMKTFVPVAPRALELATSDAKRIIQKIQSAMQESMRSLDELCQELDKEVKQVELQTFKTDGWYRSAHVLGDLFRGREELRAGLNEIRDPEAYSSYLHTQIIKASNREHPIRAPTKRFVRAACEEIQRVQSMPGGPPFAFRLWIQLKMDFALERGLDECLFGDDKSINMAILECVDTPWSKTSHLDFAWAARTVNQVMNMDIPCSNSHQWFCVHDRCYLVLHQLFQRAYTEIRVNTIRAIGRKLPQELVDLVFEHTLAAEGIPLDPRVLVPRQISETQLSRIISTGDNCFLYTEGSQEEATLMFPADHYFCQFSELCQSGLDLP